MNKIIIIGIVFISFLAAIISCCNTKYDFKYFYSPNNKSVITRVEIGSYPDYVYYTYGYYDENKVPSSYVSPNSVSGFGEGYYLYIYWNDSICTIYNSIGVYDVKDLSYNFRFETIHEYSNQWIKMMEDTTKQSIRDGSFDFSEK